MIYLALPSNSGDVMRYNGDILWIEWDVMLHETEP